MPESAIQIKGLTVTYGAGEELNRAVDSLSIDVAEGDFFALLGPNGAGKTTVISAITSLIEFDSGSIDVFGSPAGSLAARASIGVVPQELVHHGFFSVNEILNFFSGYYGIRNNQERIDFLLNQLALMPQKHKRVSQLSGGMKRRLLIAKALVHSPRLLILDEPSAGVDIELRTSLWEFVRDLNEKGTTILLTTHYLEEAQRLCNKIAIMNHGKLLALDETGDLISSMSNRVVTIKVKNASQHSARLQKSVAQAKTAYVDAHQRGDSLVVVVSAKEPVNEILKTLGVGLEEIMDIQIESGALEEAFLRIVGADHE